MNPLLESAGQIAAIIICVFALVFIILAVAFNLALAFGMSWLREKIQLIKMLRPTVESVNKATESTLQGIPPDRNENAIIRTASSIPATLQNLEKKVDESTDKVVDTMIEFRARTAQVKTIIKAFILPSSMGRKPEPTADKAEVEVYHPSDQMVLEERPTTVSVDSPSDKDDRKHIAPEEQRQHATIR
jgi:hypothetical protein